MNNYTKIIIGLVIGIAIGLVISNYTIPNVIDSKKLLVENDSLKTCISKRNEKLIFLDSTSEKLKKDVQNLRTEIDMRNQYIKILNNKYNDLQDSLNISKNNITKIKNKGYEEINNIDNWTSIQYNEFFTKFFKSHQR